MARRENRPAESPPSDSPPLIPRAATTKPAKPLRPVKIVIKTNLEDDSPPLTLIERLQRDSWAVASGYGLSLAIHLFVLTCLALVVYNNPLSEGLESAKGIFSTIISPEEFSRQQAKLAQSLKPVEIEAVPLPSSTPATATTTTTTDTADGTPTKAAAEDAKATSSNLDVPVGNAPQVGGGMRGRGGGNKSSLLKMFGGTKQSEDAVGRGLGWLARQQQSDGRWELHRGYDNPGRAELRTDTSATALALMAFMGAGYTHVGGKYKEAVGKGLSWLKKVQKPNGDLHDWDELGRPTAFIAHGQGTIALCEAYALTHDKTLVEPARKALQFTYDSQNEEGGWGYQPGAIGDMSVTGWQFMALQSARMAGFEVPEDVLARCSMFLDSVSSEERSRYRYKTTDPPSSYSPALTAEGLLCRQYLGWPKDHPALQNGVHWLLEDQNLPKWEEGKRNLYYWYYATQLMHHMEGDAWERWNTALRDQIISNQVKGGKLAGSWHPTKPEGDHHEHGKGAGRLYITCLSILTLEIYYRHLPIYRQDAVPGESAATK